MPESTVYIPELLPGHFHRNELTVKRSRFIASIGHTPGNAAVKTFIEGIRGEFPDARHHCFAFNAGRGDSAAFLGASDDGEPKGTAGPPMLNILSHSGIGEITVVVTRYFGGTLLGTGAALHACFLLNGEYMPYYKWQFRALRDLPLKPWEPVTPLWVRTELAGLSAALNRIRQAAGTVSNTEFAGESAVIRASVPSRNAEALVKTLSGIRGAEIRELQEAE